MKSRLAMLGLVVGLAASMLPAHTARAWPGGDWPPNAALAGGVSRLDGPRSIAIGPDGLMYVANVGNDSVTAYPADWIYGQTAPVKVLSGPKTGLVDPRSIDFDEFGQMYVLGRDAVLVFARDWASGDTPPLKILQGPATGLVNATSLAIDSAGRLFVTNGYTDTHFPDSLAGSVTVYPPGWEPGNTRPIRTLSGASTGLLNPRGIAFDASGSMFVTNRDSVTAYNTPFAIGNVSPSKTLKGSSTGLLSPTGIAFDDLGFMYVSNADVGPPYLLAPSVAVYAPGWASGNTEPNTALLGEAVSLQDPRGIAVDEAGHLFVTDTNRDLVYRYTPKVQTISVEGPTSATLITGKATISASAVSGLPVTIVTNSPKICDGSGTNSALIIFRTTGTCQIIATQPGDAYWAAAPKVITGLTVSPSPQSILFLPIPNVPLTRGSVRMQGVASSGLPVVWTTTTPKICRATRAFGQRITLRAVGKCTVIAQQSGDAEWQAAAQVSRDFEVVAKTTS